ncbi:MAG TPA: ATP-binding protein [Candidatus Binataceae bacterium]|nr:ATP-binding protein [Candidatus Binataceae bacterium]
MTRTLKLRLAAVILLAIVPPAVVLAVVAATHSGYWIWMVSAIGAGALFAAVAAGTIVGLWVGSVERISAIASALSGHRSPAHFATDSRDAMGRAEHLLLEAADSLVAEMARLTEEAGELDAILRGMSEAVVVTNANGAVVLLNGAALRMFELADATDQRGRDFVELCRDPRLQEFVARSMAAAAGAQDSLNGQRVASAEITIQTPTVHHLSASAAPLRPARGVAAAWVFVFHDVTQLKSYETVRSDFIANLTHELRTPLSALCGYAETLMGGVDEAETRQRFLGIIERQARRLSRLLDDLISLSDLERGFAALKMEALAPRRALAEAIDLMQEQAHRHGIALAMKCPEELPEIAADRDRVQQVMLNLIDNAIKYTPRGGSVTVESRSVADGANGYEHAGVELVVADTGDGIPAADIPRLTERFYRVDRARSRELGGTGLGLAIVKHIVQLHHGRLKIESRLREGTTVTIWLPSVQPPPG